MFKPTAIVMDYETALLDGTPSTEYYRDDFRVVSCAFAWRGEDGKGKSKYLEGEKDIRAYLAKIRASKIPVVVHNLQFEYGVTLYRFPGMESIVSIDTMRLVQVGDNGGKLGHISSRPQTYDDMLDAAEKGGDDSSSYRSGLGLVNSASRWLPERWHNHKEPYHSWLRENRGVKKGQEGKHLTELPSDMFEKYNVSDAIVTLLLYERLTEEFRSLQYDWTLDHRLYCGTAKQTAEAKGEGLPVDRKSLIEYVSTIQAEIAKIEGDFRACFLEPIQQIEAEVREAWVLAVKQEKTRVKRRLAIEEGTDELRFNVGSNKQLDRLFRYKLGITPKFWTKAPKNNPKKPRKKPFVPSPSFKAAHLSTYGDGGTMLRERRKRMLVLSQAKSLLGLSRYDSKWHFDIKACGTATGRMAGGQI